MFYIPALKQVCVVSAEIFSKEPTIRNTNASHESTAFYVDDQSKYKIRKQNHVDGRKKASHNKPKIASKSSL